MNPTELITNVVQLNRSIDVSEQHKVRVSPDSGERSVRPVNADSLAHKAIKGLLWKQGFPVAAMFI